MKTLIYRLTAAGSIFALAWLAGAQQSSPAPRTPPTVGQIMMRDWQDIGRKIVEMAQEFPEDKYDYKPNPEVRSFAEQVLHVATGNVYSAKVAHGEKTEYVELARDRYPSKADVVAVLRQSFADTNAILKSESEEQMKKRPGLWLGFLEHAGEHYGQLVVYYRMNGLVPPESRPKPKAD